VPKANWFLRTPREFLETCHGFPPITSFRKWRCGEYEAESGRPKLAQIGWVKEKGNRLGNIEGHPTPSSMEGKRLPDDGRSLVNGKLCCLELAVGLTGH